MKEFWPVLKNCTLFEGIEEKELNLLVDCLSPRSKKYRKGEFIFLAGSSVSVLGVVRSGMAHIIHEDYWGNRAIVAPCPKGDYFGEAFAAAGLKNIPLSVQAAANSEIIFINCSRVITTCTSLCKFHTRLQINFIRSLARKNIALLQKMNTLTRRGTRGKIMSYLSSESLRAKSNSFTIPFNREQLADFLSVNRSALSTELAKMQGEGLIEFRKNVFTLKKEEE